MLMSNAADPYAQPRTAESKTMRAENQKNQCNAMQEEDSSLRCNFVRRREC